MSNLIDSLTTITTLAETFTDGTHYVSEYGTDRCYGGPEEGGWYYDWHTFRRVVAVFANEDEAVGYCRHLNTTEREGRREEGRRDRFSVVGGQDTTYSVESTPREDESTERPHYE